MKYFTKEWCYGYLTEKKIITQKKSYEDYIASIYHKLPFSLKILYEGISLHDGALMKICFDNNKHILILKGVFGDLQVGYFLLEIKYLKVQNLHDEFLKNVFKNQRIEILSHEIEMLSKEHYSHRMIFNTRNEIEIIFSDMQLKLQNTTQKKYFKSKCKLDLI